MGQLVAAGFSLRDPPQPKGCAYNTKSSKNRNSEIDPLEPMKQLVNPNLYPFLILRKNL